MDIGKISPEKKRGVFFFVVSILLLFLSVVAFSDNLFTNVTQPSNRDPKFIIHGLFGLSWSVLLVIQSNLVRIRNIRLHRTLGAITFFVALGVVLSTLYVFIVLWKGWESMPADARANRLLLPGFALFIYLAWISRKKPDWHKRYLICGSFLMLGPVLSRSYDPLIISWMEPAFPDLTSSIGDHGYLIYRWGVWIGFFVAMAVLDLRTLRKIHAVTFAGLVWLLLATLVSEIL